jgi:hypothetical protein
MWSIGSGSMVFEPRLRLAGFEPSLKAQPIEPEELVHKISLEFSVIRYLPLFLKFLLLDTKMKFNHSLQHLYMQYIYIMYSIGSG